MRRRDFLGALAAAAASWPAFTPGAVRREMRPLRLDITGTTDSNGNATIPVKLPQTGEWHIAKFSLSIGGPAEWSIVVSGSVATYGRGRRVTLGPEMIQDGELVNINVTGAQPKAPIIGAANGISGPASSILAAYTPQPNTIALDVSGAGTTGIKVGSANSPATLTVPTGAISAVWRLLSSTQVTGQLVITGGVTGIQYLGPITVTNVVGSTGDLNGAFDLDPADTTLTISVTDSLNHPVFEVWTLPVAAAVYQNPNTTWKVSMMGTNPPPWMAGTQRATLNGVSVASGASTVAIAAVANQNVYPSRYSLFESGGNSGAGGRWSFQDTSGATFHDCLTSGNRGPVDNGDFEGVPLTLGLGLQLRNGGANTESISGFIDFQQF